MNALERRVEALCSDPRCSDRCRARWGNFRLVARTPEGVGLYEVEFEEGPRIVEALGSGLLGGYCEAHQELVSMMSEAPEGIETPFTRRNREVGA
jgi:hypothetical protein